MLAVVLRGQGVPPGERIERAAREWGGPQGEAQAVLVYRKPDDEYFHRHCSWSFTFQNLKETPADELQPVRLAMLVPPPSHPRRGCKFK